MKTERGTLLDEARLEEAVAIHEACYRLMQWLATAVDIGFVPYDRAHGYLSDSEAAAEWIGRHFASLPPACRPTVREGEPLHRFANYFASYLKSSFILHAIRHRPVSSSGCWCDCCRYLRDVGHLQARTPDAKDRKRAERMKETGVIELALGAGRRLSDDQVQSVLADERRSTDAAMVAYGIELVRRCDGGGSGPAALALWRQFAWKKVGVVNWQPRRDYELTARAMLDAEKRLGEAVQSC
jgi:hypothetical protein